MNLNIEELKKEYNFFSSMPIRTIANMIGIISIEDLQERLDSINK
ncbi:hypothetical protein [Terrisporobacter sp.]